MLTQLLILLVRLLIGAHPRWVGSVPNGNQRIYFANHSSHLDALTLWAALPPAERKRTHPVAARDYWDKTPWRNRLAVDGFNAVFIDRQPKAHGGDPLQPLADVLARGDSLILFPEGTRHTEPLPGAFKGGLHHLATRFPNVELVPVYLENLHRSMPKGTFFPIPLICTVRFGAVLERRENESKPLFLERARAAVIETGMNPKETFLWAIVGVIALLFIASLIGWVLQRQAKSEQSRATVANLNARIRAWWLMVAVFGIAFLLNKPAVLLLFALVSYLALREFLTLTPTKPGDHRQLFISFFIVLPAQYYLIGIGWYGMFSIFIPVFVFLFLPAYTIVATPDTEDFLTRIAKVQWGVMLAIYCISHAPALLLLNIPGYEGQNVLLLFYLLLVAQMSDVLQYVFGKLFGKTPVAPLVSPGKTVEGFIGGGLSATLLGTALWWMTPFRPLAAAGMSFIVVLLGFLGGLTLSAIKRSLGAKDWGHLIEGHGGVLDRLDSISFAAPIFFHLTRYFYVP